MRKLIMTAAAVALVGAVGCGNNNGDNNGTNNGTAGSNNGTAGSNNGTAGSNNGTAGSNNGTTAGSNNGTTAGTNNGTTAGTNNGTTAGTNNGTTNAGPSDNCAKYCELVLANCTGADEIYADEATCLTACEGFDDNGTDCATDPSTCSAETTGVQCRVYHASVAGTDATTPPVHCPHAAIDGGGVCN